MTCLLGQARLKNGFAARPLMVEYPYQTGFCISNVDHFGLGARSTQRVQAQH